MTVWTLVQRNLRFHARPHAGALLGATIGSAVLIGALVVGDSVRGTLRDNALRRLAGTKLALETGDRFFTASLVEGMFKGKSDEATRLQESLAVRAGSTGRRGSALLRLPATAARQDN